MFENTSSLKDTHYTQLFQNSNYYFNRLSGRAERRHHKKLVPKAERGGRQRLHQGHHEPSHKTCHSGRCKPKPLSQSVTNPLRKLVIQVGAIRAPVSQSVTNPLRKVIIQVCAN